MKIRWDWGVYISLVLIALVLALKNPYDSQSLIPNLEPYPDTLFYSYPAMNFIQKGSWSMETFATNPKIVTPPGFTLYLFPFLALRQNVLDFFWAQVILLVGCIIVFIHLSRILFPRDLVVQGLLGILFITNFYILTMPSLLMAELISMFCFLVALRGHLSFNESHGRNSSILGTLYLGFIKFSNSALVGVLTILDIVRHPRVWKKYGIVAGLILLFIWQSKILAGHKNLQPGASFSLTYFQDNVVFYIKTLLGYHTHYLWYQERLISPLLAILGIGGLIAGARNSVFKHASRTLIFVASAHILFMSSFVTPDARYVSMLIPVILIGVAIACRLLLLKLPQKKLYYALIAIILLLHFFIPQFSQSDEVYALTLKKQIGLNYLHPEEPWNYLAIQKINSFIHQKYNDTSHRPIYIGTFLPPHFVSYFSREAIVVPLTLDQEFFSAISTLPGNSQTIQEMYTFLLTQGDVYVTPAYSANNPTIWNPAFSALQSEFTLQLVNEGCYSTCNLYKLSSK